MPNPFTHEELVRTLDADTLTRAFRARLAAMKLDGEELVHQYRENTARTLLCAGLALIPSDHLLDNQFVVSRGVYDAAMKIAKL